MCQAKNSTWAAKHVFRQFAVVYGALRFSRAKDPPKQFLKICIFL